MPTRSTTPATVPAAAARGDADELAKTAHRLKSSSAEVGARRLAQMCKELEVKGRTQALTGVAELAEELVEELELVRHALESRSS